MWRIDGSGNVVSTLTAARGTDHLVPGPCDRGRARRAHLGHLVAGTHWPDDRCPPLNRAGTAFGARVTARRPPGGISTGNVDAARPTASTCSPIAAAGTGAKSVRHTQLYPGLTLVRQSVARRPRGRAAVTFVVLDAGEPVAGARVRVGGNPP